MTGRTGITLRARPLCGNCPACQEVTRGILGSPAPCVQAGRVPTAAELERHARRFGPEAVAETAEALGVKVAVEAPARKRAARGPTLKARIRGHLDEGRSVELIAEFENLSPSRARRIIEEVQRGRG